MAQALVFGMFHLAAGALQALERGVAPSCLYGAEHLLRLCAKMPYLVPVSGASPEAYAALQEQLATFAAFLTTHQSAFFTPLTQYIAAK